MSAQTEEEIKEELKKIGRGPATMAGGMRIARKEKRTSENDNSELKNELFETEANSQTSLVRHGNNMKHDYPEVAIRAFHEKPHPTHEPLPSINLHETRYNNKIFQPRKN